MSAKKASKLHPTLGMLTAHIQLPNVAGEHAVAAEGSR